MSKDLEEVKELEMRASDGEGAEGPDRGPAGRGVTHLFKEQQRGQWVWGKVSTGKSS